MQILRKFDASVATFIDDGAKVKFQIFTALALIICIGYQLVAIKFPYSMDYGEAPLVDQAMRLAAGQNIYRADISTLPYTISNCLLSISACASSLKPRQPICNRLPVRTGPDAREEVYPWIESLNRLY